MLVIEDKIDVTLDYHFNGYNLNDTIFFDIETTGFSPETTALYLIGCLYYREDHWNLIQWFANDYTSEKEILISFFAFLKDFKILVHYNGTGFDIPYLLKKCRFHQLDYSFDQIDQIDIYKKINPYKKTFRIPNLKQKTIEQFLDISREDTYSGGELIDVYRNYLLGLRTNSENSNELKVLLLLHNKEDLIGMLKVSKILCYPDLFEKDFEITKTNLEEEFLQIQILFGNSLPKRISFGNDILYLNAFGNHATIKINLYKNELKFFYDNYKDYFYLPKEDTAIHKSVAFYVDKDFRTRAKAANCYSKKTGCFVPQYKDIITPYFKIDYLDKVKYIETTEEFLNNYEDIKKYVSHLFTHFVHGSK
ncbi:ribonuclease H-like domain-containing protein [Anaeromicropila herbilytica]|uniref:YprB ribonuclease H-like domain-containing protein n=1 Tax=Anaeromicropila herbilytica TaxID=2785025 RepID=A0A7R7EKM2_9FIRM|nr:ribonuclease H-like domain-containing protein [Anaeromicropila herbilytica]BCN30493.1 hypothetical protein bsdtb5_17880 [Anaeromicropila herbilytica]